MRTRLWDRLITMVSVAAREELSGASYGHGGHVGPSPESSDMKVAVEHGTALKSARGVAPPERDAVLRRDPSVTEYWYKYSALFEQAWAEWVEHDSEGASLPALDDSVFEPKLREAVAEAWTDPVNKEGAVRDLWTEVAPDVFACQLLDPSQIHRIRAHFDRAEHAGIPVRQPYGIVLNRKGFMLDERSAGYFAAPGFQAFYKFLTASYMRPIGRLFYPDYIQRDDDSQTFGFSIAWQEGPAADKNIMQHTDASALTFNINMNLPSESGFEGAAVYFVDPATRLKTQFEFKPGVALMHRGAAPHASLPITKGERRNMVLWLYGAQGEFSHYPYATRMNAKERWTKPEDDSECAAIDRWSPF